MISYHISQETYKLARRHKKEYEEGLTAFLEEKKALEDNPYDKDKQFGRFVAWRAGWFGIL